MAAERVRVTQASFDHRAVKSPPKSLDDMTQVPFMVSNMNLWAMFLRSSPDIYI